MSPKRNKPTNCFYAWYSTYFAMDMISKALHVPKSKLIEKACELYLSEEWLSETKIEDNGVPGSASVVSYTISKEYTEKIDEIMEKLGLSRSKIINAILVQFLKQITRVLPLLKKNTLGTDDQGNYLFSVENLKCEVPFDQNPELMKKIKKIFYNDKKKPTIILLQKRSKWELALYLAIECNPSG